MEVINAIWEKRNIEVDAYEIRLSCSDCLRPCDVFSELRKDKYKKSYVTIKVPVNHIDLLHQLEDFGFRFMEMQFHVAKNLLHYKAPDKISSLKMDIKQKEIAKTISEWKDVTNLIDEDMFHTDRIYVDPKLKFGTSCKRYKNWMMDLVGKPDYHLFLYYDDKTPIGFGLVCFDNLNKKVYVVLEGIFTKYQHMGYGSKMFDVALTSYAQKGFESLETCISSNNFPIIKIDLLFGYSIIDEVYVLRNYA